VINGKGNQVIDINEEFVIWVKNVDVVFWSKGVEKEEFVGGKHPLNRFSKGVPNHLETMMCHFTWSK
jgi:hypothetical protein